MKKPDITWVKICCAQSSCENCPLFDECFTIKEEIVDDYITMEPDESSDNSL